MSKMILSPRLQCVAEKIHSDKRLVDVGTDHAYLPVYIIQNNIAKHAIAADLRQGPLKKAQETISAFHLEGFIETRFSDGLSNISPGEADEIVMAGMGGELIAHLMSQCAWVKNKEKHFIFQPMTHSEILRCYLIENGFSISSEDVVVEGNKVYVVLDACYTGEYKEYPPHYLFTGGIKDFSSAPSKQYLQRQIHYLSNKLLGEQNQEITIILKELQRIYDNC